MSNCVLHFTTVGNTLAANLPQTDNDPIELIESNPDNFFCIPTTPAEINNLSCLVEILAKTNGQGTNTGYISRSPLPVLARRSCITGHEVLKDHYPLQEQGREERI